MRSGCACLLIIVIYFRRNSGSRGSDPSGPIDGNGGQSRTGSLSRPSVLDHATHKPASRRQASCPSCSDERCATLRHSAARFLQSSTLIIVAPHRQLQTQNSLSLHSERPSTIVDVLFGVPKLCPLCTACLSFRAAARYLPCSTADKLKSHGWTREQSGTSRYACVYPRDWRLVINFHFAIACRAAAKRRTETEPSPRSKGTLLPALLPAVSPTVRGAAASGLDHGRVAR